MNDDKNSPGETLEIIHHDATILETMERAQIDMQIATAKRYPRDLDKILARVLGDATKTEAVAESCIYSLPARRGSDKAIEGPSVRLAEIFISRWNNLRVATQFTGDDGKFVTVRAIVNDVETNTVVASECRRRVTTKEGRRYSDDMIGVTVAAAASIARRNAAFQIIPRAFVDEVYDAARKVSMGDVKTLASRRAAALDDFKKRGISNEKVFAALKVSGIEGIDLEALATLTGYRNAIKEGTATLDEIFNAPPPAPDEPSTIAGKVVTPVQGAFPTSE